MPTLKEITNHEIADAIDACIAQLEWGCSERCPLCKLFLNSPNKCAGCHAVLGSGCDDFGHNLGVTYEDCAGNRARMNAEKYWRGYGTDDERAEFRVLADVALANISAVLRGKEN